MRNINGNNKRNTKRNTKRNNKRNTKRNTKRNSKRNTNRHTKRDELEWMRAMKEHYHLRCLYHVHFMPPLLQKTAKESRSGTVMDSDEQ
jgi:hypothetical protein